ncbi:ABC transporter permease [Pleomorphomonas sp. JP5]|uniref:ABC transporter permease n=1 Tax=Pleomorphomonas sp. JP5 TaxID=2942998 RepID=UPI0020449A4D|nr:ABC transporter permease subunit [Pleomorphomonas sp. JP5]MCM5558897.1 ABC transporter permease subunit [Pleomorphomonas sp. JP5]
MISARSQSFVLGLIGISLFLVAWEVIGTYHLAGLTWPPLSTVLAFLTTPAKLPLFGRAAAASFTSVAIGYLCGAFGGLALALVSHLVAPVRPGLDRLVAVIHAIPSIALAPLLIVLASADATPPVISGLGVGYIFYVAATSGLATASASHRDLFAVLGASRLSVTLRLDLPSAFPAIASAMKLSVPIAFIGAIIGEWFGASRGLGLLIVSAMQNFQIPLLWSAVLITAIASLTLFALFSLAERLVQERMR